MKRILITCATVAVFALAAFSSGIVPVPDFAAPSILQSFEVAEAIPWMAVIAAAAVFAVVQSDGFGSFGAPEERSFSLAVIAIVLMQWIAGLFKTEPDCALSGGDG